MKPALGASLAARKDALSRPAQARGGHRLGQGRRAAGHRRDRLHRRNRATAGHGLPTDVVTDPCSERRLFRAAGADSTRWCGRWRGRTDRERHTGPVGLPCDRAIKRDAERAVAKRLLQLLTLTLPVAGVDPHIDCTVAARLRPDRQRHQARTFRIPSCLPWLYASHSGATENGICRQDQ